jgi:hypothetical protein
MDLHSVSLSYLSFAFLLSSKLKILLFLGSLSIVCCHFCFLYILMYWIENFIHFVGEKRRKILKQIEKSLFLIQKLCKYLFEYLSRLFTMEVEIGHYRGKSLDLDFSRRIPSVSRTTKKEIFLLFSPTKCMKFSIQYIKIYKKQKWQQTMDIHVLYKTVSCVMPL